MRATPQPMPENRTSDKGGLWRVRIESEDGTFDYKFENVTHDKALREASTLNQGFREDKTLH